MVLVEDPVHLVGLGLFVDPEVRRAGLRHVVVRVELERHHEILRRVVVGGEARDELDEVVPPHLAAQ